MDQFARTLCILLLVLLSMPKSPVCVCTYRTFQAVYLKRVVKQTQYELSMERKRCRCLQSCIILSLNASPWRPSGDTLHPKNQFAPSYDQNGGYFLGIVDYADPKLHSNLFLHHRKVAMDTDTNVDFIDDWGGPWSKVWNSTKYVDDRPDTSPCCVPTAMKWMLPQKRICIATLNTL